MTNWIEIIEATFSGLWIGLLDFIPSLIIAILVFVAGWFIAIGSGRVIVEILKKLKVDKIFEKGSCKQILTKADLKVDVPRFIGAIVKWVLVIVFLMITVEILGLDEFAIFLKDILVYLPNVIIAALIFVIAVIIIDIVEKTVRVGVEGIKLGYGQIISTIIRWSLWIFVILAILHQLEVAPALMEILLFGIVAMLAISFGLAFGLGGKDVAAEILQDLKKKLKKDEQ
jgi:hypothetical protein